MRIFLIITLQTGGGLLWLSTMRGFPGFYFGVNLGGGRFLAPPSRGGSRSGAWETGVGPGSRQTPWRAGARQHELRRLPGEPITTKGAGSGGSGGAAEWREAEKSCAALAAWDGLSRTGLWVAGGPGRAGGPGLVRRQRVLCAGVLGRPLGGEGLGPAEAWLTGWAVGASAGRRRAP